MAFGKDFYYITPKSWNPYVCYQCNKAYKFCYSEKGTVVLYSHQGSWVRGRFWPSHDVSTWRCSCGVQLRAAIEAGHF